MCSLKGCGYNNPSPTLLHLPGAWVASPLQQASQGGKTDPSASESEMLPCLGFGADVAFLPQAGSQGGKWGRAGAEPQPILLIPAASRVCTHPTAPETGTLQHRGEINTRNVQLFSHPASNSCWINAVY